MNIRKPFFYAFAVTLGLLAATGVLAWTGPTIAPPGSNASAPINTSATSQIKSGAFTATSLGGSTVCVGTNCLNSSGTSIYYNGGNVGIGIASPVSTLDIYGTGANATAKDSTITATNPTQACAGCTFYGGKFSSAGNAGGFSSANVGLYATASGGLGGNYAAVFDQGYVGINSTAPTAPLDVRGPLTATPGTGTINLGAVGDRAYWAIRQTPSADLSIDSYTSSWVSDLFIGRQTGNVGIGTVTPNGRFEVANAGSGWAGMFNYNNGAPSGANGIWVYGSSYAIYANGPVYGSAFYYSSDERLKKNIQTIASSTALQKILALNPVTFNWIPTDRATTTQIGFIAQEVEKVVPELVYDDASTTMKAVDYARVAPLLVGAIQAQQAQIDELKAELKALKAARQ
jgi:hypothetical protein